MDTDMKDPTQQALVDTKKTAVLSDTPKQQGRRIFLIVGQVLLEHGHWVLPRGLVVVVCVWGGQVLLLRRPLVLFVTLGSPMSPIPPLTHLEQGTALKIHAGFLGC